MANLAVGLEELAASLGDAVTWCVLGVHYRHQFEEAKDPAPVGRLMTWKNAKPFLDEEYGDGWGEADCRPFVAWSKNWVFWVHEYDGSTHIAKAPRRPVLCKPDFSGV